ncbi:MAG: hypothetical protein EOP48_33940 [Sphingobacteriales bacterium]|nr:MAG: hypothetical protein EOP48_33940 [Sphingobacteriales bacterium]
MVSNFASPFEISATNAFANVNVLGYLRVMFTVLDVEDTLTRPSKLGAKLVGELAQYEDIYRLCYIRGSERVLIRPAWELRLKISHCIYVQRKLATIAVKICDTSIN